MLGRVVRMGFVPSWSDAGLLFLRLSIGLNLFLKHGYEKLFHFSRMAPGFSDPLHLGHTTSLVMAAFSDGICSVLVMIGLATRWACLYSFIVIFVAWSVRDHFMYFGRLVADHGELSVLYLVGLVAIFITGPGGYSLDARLND